MSTLAAVWLWGTRIGAVSLADEATVATFEYEPAFAASQIELSPLSMPLSAGRPYRFATLAQESFSGLPGLLADSLPDRYGTALIDAWLASQGREAEELNAVERLCYVGQRGMGALEYTPTLGPDPKVDRRIDVEALTELAAEVLAERSDLAASLRRPDKQEALREILRVGTSAGGARAKALIALNPATGEIRSGQLSAPPGFEHWILKFDGVDDETRDLGAALGYGVVEWVYSRMARAAGIEMNPCRLLEDGERRHFMTRRFDRDERGGKLHMQSLGALAHLDFNQVGANSYEQAFQVIHRLGLPRAAAAQQFRRMVFNVVARNQDDHVKNIAFLMDRQGRWSLAPAYDMVYAHNRRRGPTRRHQMTINGKRDDFSIGDLRSAGEVARLKRGEAEAILAEVTATVETWPRLAADAGLPADRIERIRRDHRLDL